MQAWVIGSYFGILTVLWAYGMHRSFLVWLLRRHPEPAQAPAAGPEEALPTVLVQLPVFNEANVIERLITAACDLDYPRDRLSIQVLDDSTDETTTLARQLVEAQQARGIKIELIHRQLRCGFKAGALAAGLARSRAELVAIFDADFVPRNSFLLETVGCFSDPGVGMVQARWEHLNRDHSLLTRLQAHLLDAHFLIEHDARNRSGRFFNFNGTAGIWRRRAIEDAGGWQGDTLTEDLDLSYRAQLKGWRFVFLPGVTVPAELPEDLNAFKSQQRRWAKGAVQTARKLLGTILRAKVPLRVKVEAFFHLTANIAHPLMVVLALLLLPNLLYRFELGWSMRWIITADAVVILGATGSLAVFYAAACRRAEGQGRHVLLRLPALMALGIGISASNAIAVLGGLFGSVGTFVRTPKNGTAGSREAAPLRRYRGAVGWLPWLELVFAVHSAAAVVAATTLGTWGSLPFLLLFPFGYLGVSLVSLWATRPAGRPLSPRS